MICCTFCMVQLSMFLRLVLSPVVFSNLYFLCRVSTRHLDSCPPRDMILWVLEFNDEGVIFMQSFSVSVHPDEQRRNSRDGYNSFAEFNMSTGGDVYLIKIKTEMKKHKVLFATSHANKGLNRTHAFTIPRCKNKKITCKLACVASVFNRVIARKLERKQKRGYCFFALVPAF